ncbi:hypothetical protein JCM19241_5615 [Vibrio ishigakensis]|uniref:Uncharacterized protein n=1 Tax=Vibrio ishigakensis TaxID=1481914 RepID=A0A0B8QIM7_9VIBR|nr:hypothetical protein JCM19241_5615 [Vibrio ishigakensis]
MPELTTHQLLSAVSKVEKVNHIKLEKLTQIISDNPQQAIDTFTALVGLESMDDRFKYIVNSQPHLQSEMPHLLETSVLLG